MNYDEYRILRGTYADVPSLITASDLRDKTPRVLLNGYYPSGTDPQTLRVELEGDGVIRTYEDGRDITHHVTINEHYVPSKRVYPQKSDFEFCRLLIERGVNVPFLGHSYPEEKERV